MILPCTRPGCEDKTTSEGRNLHEYSESVHKLLHWRMSKMKLARAGGLVSTLHHALTVQGKLKHTFVGAVCWFTTAPAERK